MSVAVPVLGLLAGVVGVLDTIPYVRDTLVRSTVPHRGTWLVWSVLEIGAVLSQHADGASWSLVMAITQAVGTTLVLALSVRLGRGGLSLPELALMALAGVGIAGWLVADEPVFATACIVGADLAAVAMMVPKAWHDPRSETTSTYALASVSGACAAGAVGALTPSLLLYPVYFCLSNAALALLIHGRRAQGTLTMPTPGTAARARTA